MAVRRCSTMVASAHLERVLAGRNDERVVVFANGHVFDRAERRKGARVLIGMCRRERDDLVLETIWPTQREAMAALLARTRGRRRKLAIEMFAGRTYRPKPGRENYSWMREGDDE